METFKMYDGTLITAGEVSCTRPFSIQTEPAWLALVKVLRDADVVYAHEEEIIHSFEGYNVRPFELDMLVQADPIIADELKWLGVDMVSACGNHCFEWGEDGILANNNALDRAGVAHAGTGMNLEEAQMPAYVQTNAGRVALIACSSGHHPYDSAGLTKPPVRGRPGLNPLRTMMKYILDHDSARKLKEVWETAGIAKALRPEIRRYVKLGEGDFYLDFEHVNESYNEGFYFGVADTPSIVMIPNQWDIERILKQVKEAKKQADLVLVAHHNAASEGLRDWFKPSSFIPPFAKAYIDAGADAYIGHGWHRELGLEIYKNKPIFYSVGNFFVQHNFKKAVPVDTYEGKGLDLNYLTAYTPSDARRPLHPDEKAITSTSTAQLTPMEIGGYFPY